MFMTTFADPKTDFIFKLIFGTEANKHCLIGLLNDLLELEGADRIRDVTYLLPEQAPPIPEMKLSVVDVKCRDQKGRTYVVEMQVLNVESFEKRILLNASNAYFTQLPSGEPYHMLAPVVGVTICDFVFWPVNGSGPPRGVTASGSVPMLSHWRIQEQQSGSLSFSDVRLRFLELPKYTAGPNPLTRVERWAYFFREAVHLRQVPPVLQEPPFCDALELARTANLTPAQWEAYDRSRLARQDAHGAVSLAHREGEKLGLEKGREEGREEGLRHTVHALCQVMGIEWSEEHKAQVEAMSFAQLETLKNRLMAHKHWP